MCAVRANKGRYDTQVVLSPFYLFFPLLFACVVCTVLYSIVRYSTQTVLQPAWPGMIY